jgi:hypothetical protein
MNVVEALNLVKDKLSTGWTQKTCARDKRGLPVASCDREAVCWCMIGAIGRVTDGDVFNETVEALEAALPRGYGFVSEFNDAEGRKVEDVFALIDKAIERESRA